MTEAVLVRQAVDPEKVADLREWLAELSERTDEAVETMRDEGVATESMFVEESARGTFLVTYMEAADLQEAQEAFAASTHDVDVEHKRVMEECLVDDSAPERYEPMFHAANPDR